MYSNNNSRPEADIYALLSNDNDPIMNGPSIDNSTLMMSMFNNNEYLLEHPLSEAFPSSTLSASNDLNLHQEDLINFDFTQQQQYTPSDSTDPFFMPQRLNQRRHSVAANALSHPPLTFVHPSIDHRASMPNIFHPQPDRLGPTSVKRNHTPPIQFNSLPWSNDSLRRKRCLSQQYDMTPQPSGLCPLPMSGVPSRRVSMATPSDISTWHKMTHQSTEPVVKEESPERNISPIEEQPDYPNITDADVEAAKGNPNAIPRRQKLRYEGDEYTPKWVRYTGQLKEGYCDTCPSGKWLQLKNSAYWYHKQFFHGISSVSGKRFQNPLEKRHGDHDTLEGLCHQCKEFVPICNSKRKNSVLWYRHAHKCHIYDRPKPRLAGTRRDSIHDHPSKKAKFSVND